MGTFLNVCIRRESTQAYKVGRTRIPYTKDQSLRSWHDYYQTCTHCVRHKSLGSLTYVVFKAKISVILCTQGIQMIYNLFTKLNYNKVP